MSLGKVEAQDPRMLPLLRGGGEEGRRGGGKGESQQKQILFEYILVNVKTNTVYANSKLLIHKNKN